MSDTQYVSEDERWEYLVTSMILGDQFVHEFIIMMSKNDHSVSLDNPEYVMKNVSSTEKESIWLENSGHVISVDYEKERVFKETLAFIEAHAN